MRRKGYRRPQPRISAATLRQLLGIGRLGQPRQLQRIVLVARDHVHVEVEDRLPRGPADVVQDVEPVRAAACRACGAITRRTACIAASRSSSLELEQVLGVRARDHDRVAARRRIDVHDRQRALVGVDHLAGDLAGDDLAEDAVRLGGGHGRKLIDGPRRRVFTMLRALMPVDNQLYDRLGDTWWQEDSLLSLLRTSINPARFGYMRRVLTEDARHRPAGLDGARRRMRRWAAGGGVRRSRLPRDRRGPVGRVARDGARTRARSSGLEIEYVEGTGEQLPFADAAFDAVYCCDVLEHVDDLQRTLDESARVLKPGGVYMYDTINRTRRSKLVMIKLFQEWRSTAHDGAEPARLGHVHQARRARGGARGRRASTTATSWASGRAATRSSLIRDLRSRARGDMTFGEFGTRNVMRETRDTLARLRRATRSSDDRTGLRADPGAAGRAPARRS